MERIDEFYNIQLEPSEHEMIIAALCEFIISLEVKEEAGAIDERKLLSEFVGVGEYGKYSNIIKNEVERRKNESKILHERNEGGN